MARRAPVSARAAARTPSRSHHRRSPLFARCLSSGGSRRGCRRRRAAAAACDPADAAAAAAVPVTSLKCVAAIGRQSVTEEQAPHQVSRDTTSYKGPRTYRQTEQSKGTERISRKGSYTPNREGGKSLISLSRSVGPPSLPVSLSLFWPLCDIAPLLAGDSVRPADKLCHLHRHAAAATAERGRRSRENRLFYPPIWILTIRNEGRTKKEDDEEENVGGGFMSRKIALRRICGRRELRRKE